jgi:DNA-binding CsgD family transcriptional regulator
MLSDRLLNAIRDVYDCATDATRWSACLTSIGTLLHGTSTNLLYHDDRAKGGIEIAIGADPELYRLYSEYGHAIDPWVSHFRPFALASGSVIIGASVVAHSRFKQTEFYAAIGQQYGVSRCVVGVLETSPHRIAVLTINRGDRSEEFDQRDARLVSTLVPHIRRALTIQRRLVGIGDQRASITDALDRLALGIVLVDDHGRPLFLNQYASRLLQQRDGLSIERCSLIAAAAATQTRLARALESAIAVTLGRAFNAETSELLIPRLSGRRSFHASVSPIARHNAFVELATPAAALVFLLDPESVALPLSERLRELFSLTTAETRVAGLMATGRDVAAMSVELRVSRETVRTQVKRVLEKASVRSQSAFVRLVATDSIRFVGLANGA